MKEAFTQHELPVGCAIQWRQCVTRAIEQLAELPDSQVLTIRYEQFTKNAAVELKKVCDFLKADVGAVDFASLTKGVSSRSVGKWKQQLSANQLAKLDELIGPLLAKLEYCDGSDNTQTAETNSLHQA